MGRGPSGNWRGDPGRETAPRDDEMDRPTCRRCHREVYPGRGDYYLVRIDAVADPEPPVFTEEDLDQDVGAEIERLIRRMKGLGEEQLERQVHRQKAIYLC